jgi:SulP family sulfate permease
MSLSTELKEMLDPGTLVPGIVAGVVAGVLSITFMFSYSAVIFAEELAVFIPRATGQMLFGAVVISLIVALFGQLRGTVALPQDNPTAILAIMAASIAATSAATGDGEQVYVFVTLIMALSALLAGGIFYAIGHWRLTGLVQYIPYPVIGGFLAGTGWLLFKGSFSVMADVPFDLTNLSALGAVIQLWLPGVIFAITVFVVTMRFSHFLVMPGLIMMAVVLFYLGMLITDSSLAHAIQARWLLEPFGGDGLWRSLDWGAIAEVKWTHVWDQIGGISTILVIATISILLNLTALESAFQRELDFNREMRTVGVANALGAFGGTLIGYHYVSLSTLGHRMKGDTRVVGLVVALMCLLALTVGAGALSYFPKYVLGGLVMFVGISFLWDWVVQSWRRLSKGDFAIIVLILGVVETVGFLEAVAFGIGATAVLFIISYSQINVVRHTLSGRELHSHIDRSSRQRDVLLEKGEGTQILSLQGFIFFTTTNGLIQRVEQRLADSRHPLRYLVIDFTHVTGLDTSALHGFVKIKQKVSDHDAKLVLCNLSPQVKHVFVSERFDDGDAVVDTMFSDLDHALGWCEDRILEEAGIVPRPESHPLDEVLADAFPDGDSVTRFKLALSRQEIAAGDSLVHQHDHRRAIHFLEKGTMTVSVDKGEGRNYRLRLIGPGSLIGAAGFFHSDSDESLVTVEADEDAVVYTLTMEALEKLNTAAPEVYAMFQRFLLVYLSDRLASNLELLQATLHIDE